MNSTRHRLATVTTCVVVVAWVVFYAVSLARADERPGPVTGAVQLVVPPLLWVLAARLVLHHGWLGTEARLSRMDPPERMLAAAVSTLPTRRREWGLAMLAELAEVPGRSARWRFALSSARAALLLPPAGGWPLLVVIIGAILASVVTVGPAVGTAVPGLRVFAMTFIGLVGAMFVLAVARSRRPRLPVPVPTLVVAGSVVASIAATVVFLRLDPTAAAYLPPSAAAYLAVVLAGCLWIAVAPPRWLGANRLATHLGVAAGVAFAAWFLLWTRTDGTEPPLPVVVLLAAVLVLTPVAVFVVPAFVAGRAGRSVRAGVRAAVWTVTAVVPLTYAVWLPEAMRRHAIDGRTLDGELLAPVGVNLADALAFCLGIFPVFGFALAAIGAAIGARRTVSNAR